MNIEEFLFECNQSPLLKKYSPITEETLTDLHFKRADYVLTDLRELEQILFFIPPIITENDDPEYTKLKRYDKDMLHAKIIELYDNKVYIKKLRQELKMPFNNDGFKVLKRIFPCAKSFTNVNFEFLSPNFKEWFLSWTKRGDFYDDFDQWEKTSPIVYKKVFNVVVKALEKLGLPWRYFNAIEELIIFNTIIPADTGITWHQQFENKERRQKPLFSLSFEVDTTKEELIQTIKEDICGVFKNRRKYLMGKTRMKQRKISETEGMIVLYNKYKKDGKKDKEIFAIVQNESEFNHLSISAIRDRIKRN